MTCLLATVLACILTSSPSHASTNAIRGLPFTRSYRLEDVGDVPRGARLSFDGFGRIAVVHEGYYTVLNDTAWLNIEDKETRDVRMAEVVPGNDGRVYYCGTGSWGVVELLKDGTLRPHPLVPPDAPQWVQRAAFDNIVTTEQGAYFSGWNGVVYWDFASRKNSYFEVFGASRIFKIGNQVFVSLFNGSVQSVDVQEGKLLETDTPGLGKATISQAISLDQAHCLTATKDGRILVFDGKRFEQWAPQIENNLTGQISSLLQLVDGGIAVAITGKGLFMVSPNGDVISVLTSTEYHRITHMVTREAGVLWAIGEDGIQKVHYGSPLTVFDQRLGITLSWPVVAKWKDKILAISGGRLFEAFPGVASSASRFEMMKNLPPEGAWAIAANSEHLLIGNADGVFEMTANGSFSPIISGMDVARLAMIGTDLCFVIGRLEIGVLRLRGGRWTECAPRIPAIGYPAIVHSAKEAVWIELGGNRVARLSFQDGRLRSQIIESFPWKAKSWVNIGIVDDIVVLNGSVGERVYYDDKTEKYIDAPDLRRLLDESPNWIVRIRKDELGTLWATHDQGVTTYTPKEGGYQIDSKSFILNNERFPRIQLLPGNDVWLVTGLSLYHVERRDTSDTRQALRPILVSVADGRSNMELLGEAASAEGHLQLPYSRNSLNFRFFSGSYAWRRAPIYEFRLNSVQDRWASLGTGSILSFPGLPEGNYKLEVRMARGSGSARMPTTFEFEILPPWHRTWSAYLLFGACMVLAVFGLVRWSVYSTRHQNLILEGLVQERTDQLQVTMQKLNEETRNTATLAERHRLAGEIHDSLQQGLSGLILQLDATLKLSTLAEDVRSRLNVARNMVSFTRHEVQHAVWNMESPLIEDAELGEALQKITSLIGPGAAKIDISVTGSVVPPPSATKHHLLRIAQEAITNSVRHAAPNTIAIRLDYAADSVSLAVSDDGIGFNADNVLAKGAGHFGLRGLRGRAAKISGKLQIESQPGKGTLIRVIVPLATTPKTTNDEVHPKV